MEEKHVVQDSENKMGVMPIRKLLPNMAVPMIISMLFQALYNIVDSVFVARIADESDAAVESINSGTSALNAVGMAFPFQMLLIAVGTGTCVGVNALLSKALGEKDEENAQKTAMNGVFLAICSAIVFLFIGIFFSRLLIRSQGASGLSLEYGTQYLSIVCICSIAIFCQLMFERLLQSTGRTLLSMCSQILGAVINIILDPILIFGLWKFPELKVAGAAIATVIGQIFAAIFAFILNRKFNKEIHVSFRNFKPDLAIIKKIYSIGIPTIIMQSIGSVMTFCMNKLLTSIEPAAVAVFTVYFKLQSLFFMPLFGMNNGMIPILAYNFGAKKRSRMVSVIKWSMLYAFGFMFIGFLAFEILPDKLLLIFDTKDPSLLTIGVPALRKIGFHYLLAWFCIIACTVFQTLGRGVYSMIVSICRQLVVLLPVAFLLSKVGGIPMIWWCFPIAELMSLTISSICLVKVNKDIIMKVPDLV